MSNTRELLDAIESGNSQTIDAAFTEIFSTKVGNAIENMRNDIAQNLFKVEEGVVPGSVEKDKEGHVTHMVTKPEKTNKEKRELRRKNLMRPIGAPKAE